MSETKFTKGPWDYVGDHIVGVVGNCGCPAEAYEKDERGLPLQFYPDRAHESHDVVKPIIEDDLPEGVTMEEHIANCHLISAALDLLEACESALIQIRILDPHSKRDGATPAVVEGLLEAIIKAKGEGA